MSVNGYSTIVQCYGITKDPKTNNFMIVMQYAINSSLRQYLNNNYNFFNWREKSHNLWCIADGLKAIHDKGLIHHDFHCGNILNNIKYDSSGNTYSLITDLGLCKPANLKSSQEGDKKIYGVLPYVAPEVLRGKEYTQSSDIYGFGIIAYEVCTGLPPYHDIAHDEFLAAKICQGLRPKSDYKIPQLILDIIKQCWDADPLKRPKAKELVDLTNDLRRFALYKNNLVFNEQIKEADEINKKLPALTATSSTGILSYTTHAQAIYTSRLLDFKNLPEPKMLMMKQNIQVIRIK
jgi:serine/threonine protein kinase